jgi:hypothetical protein
MVKRFTNIKSLRFSETTISPTPDFTTYYLFIQYHGGLTNMATPAEITALEAATKAQRDSNVLKLKQDLMESIGTAQAIVLLGKTPKGEIRKRLMNPKNPSGPGNPTFSYVEHAYVEQTLNLAFMLNWSVEVTHRERIDSEAFVEIILTLNFKNNVVVKKSGFGGAAKTGSPNQTWGDVFKSAYSDAIKNAATKLGIGLDLYRHEEITGEVVAKAKAVEAGQPDGQKLSGKATETQLATIKNLGGEPGENMTFAEAADKIRQLAQMKNAKKV